MARVIKAQANGLGAEVLSNWRAESPIHFCGPANRFGPQHSTETEASFAPPTPPHF